MTATFHFGHVCGRAAVRPMNSTSDLPSGCGVISRKGMRVAKQPTAAHGRAAVAKKLWCIHLAPKVQRDDAKAKRDLEFLARGPGVSEMEKLFWVTMVMNGISDNRGETWVTWRQRLMVFSDRKAALQEAKKHENEYWRATVREVRMI